MLCSVSKIVTIDGELFYTPPVQKKNNIIKYSEEKEMKYLEYKFDQNGYTLSPEYVKQWARTAERVDYIDVLGDISKSMCLVIIIISKVIIILKISRIGKTYYLNRIGVISFFLIKKYVHIFKRTGRLIILTFSFFLSSSVHAHM